MMITFIEGVSGVKGYPTTKESLGQRTLHCPVSIHDKVIICN